MKKTRGLFITIILAAVLAQPALSKSFQNKYRTKSQFNIKKSNLVAPSSNRNSQSAQLRSSAPRNSDSSNPFGSRADSFGIMKRDDSFVHLNPETAFGPEIVESFDFPDTDILELTKHMQKLTGINLILDKDVKGKVSISAPSPITVGDAWRAYLTALNMNGFTIVPSGDNFYKIIPARNIRNTPTRIYTGGYTPDTDNYIMKVIPLKHINASEVNKAFRSFMTANGRIIPMEQTNTVLVMDTGTNISRLLKLIKYLDVPGYDESLQIIPVKNSSAQEIAKLLDEILNKSGGGSRRSSRRSSKDDDEAGISKIIAEPRTNSIIAMANADGAKQLRDLIKKLDIAGSSANSGKIHVYYLQYGDAEELSQTLSGLLSAAGSGRSTSGAASSSRFSSRNNTGNQIFTDEVKVTADKNNNALVVTASPTDWLTMQGVLKKLDIPKDQVMVEGMVVETEVSKGRSFGTNIVAATGENIFDRAGFDTAGIKLSEFISQGFPSLGGLFAGIGIGQTIPIEISGQTYNVSSVNALIQAVASNSGNNVLATPKVLVMDNKDAEFEVGSTVPITTSTPGTGTTGPTQSITNQKITLRFKITPQINKVTRFVKLKIDQTIDDIAGNQDSVSAAVAANTGVQTTTRSAITEVVIKDKDTVVMGGLLRDRENTSIKKVPILGDIPVLGWLFKNKSRDITKTNILFFITPTILSPYDKVANDITEKSLRKRDEFIRPAINDGQDMPFEKEMADLMKKVQAQKSGPLYDQQDAEVYRKANEEAEVELLELELPEYEKAIEIMKE